MDTFSYGWDDVFSMNNGIMKGTQKKKITMMNK